MQSIMIKADRPRGLRFSTTAFCKLEDLTGKSTSELNEGAGMQELRAMVYCGLYWEDKNLTLEDAGDIMDIIMQNQGIDYLSDNLGKAIELALGQGKENKFKKKKNR
jgi:hypothetical protein